MSGPPRKAPTWLCHGCHARKPFLGFDLRRKLCAECQSDRPVPAELAAALLKHHERVPRKLLHQLMIALF